MIENPAEAYALVTATFRGVRYVLLIERGDGAGWAMPGGTIEPGADLGSPLFAAKRKLAEEAGLRLPKKSFVLDEPRDGVVVARCDLGEVDTLPEVRGGTDARQVRWIAVGFLDWSKGYFFPTHRKILGALR